MGLKSRKVTAASARTRLRQTQTFVYTGFLKGPPLLNSKASTTYWKFAKRNRVYTHLAKYRCAHVRPVEVFCPHKPWLHHHPLQRKRLHLSLIHICRCRRYAVCRSRWSPYH
eukprot:TRINITY_DN2438_c0_g1_i15.p1 TRINITY_DN2438_c0_g1~~TRINITY_DN2438_c0_g1_i15.p1  ORF type:complete len:112 (-),score=3.39 TRINITY_DN2438_c0_g1_i15:18-353(-)